jgi:hypothetical protein
MKFSDLFNLFGKDVEVQIGGTKFEGKLLPAASAGEMSRFVSSSVEEKMGCEPHGPAGNGMLPRVQVTSPLRPRIETFSVHGAEVFWEIVKPERVKWAELAKRAGTAFIVPAERIGISGSAAGFGRN